MKLIQKAVVKKGNKYLILLRSKDARYFPEHWDFPGGKLESNEEPVKGIEREVFEETSLRVKASKVSGVYEFDLDNNGEGDHRFTVYLTKIVSGEVRLSFEHLEFKWASKKEISSLRVEPCIKSYFREH